MLELVDGKKHIVIKRDGREEPFSWEKLNRVIDWAITYKTGIDESKKEFFRNEIIKNMKLRIHNKIKIEKLFDNLIDVTASLADRMYPEFDKIARNLFIQKWYKETWGMKRDEYPDYEEVIKKGIGYSIYDPEIFNSFSAKEIQELNNMIKNERDFKIASFLGITLMHNKYSLNYTKNKKLELPQHTFMRIAINSFFIEKENRLNYIEKMYNFLSEHYFTRATPYYLNAGTLFRMLASCVLTQMIDDSNSINKTIHNLGIYSRHGGGTACDVSKIRSVDSIVAKTGRSSGKIPFIKMIEATMTAFNQKNARQGACAVYFNWWDYEVKDLIYLKDEGGSEEKRARKLQYSIKINEILLKRAVNDEEITLFDPKDVPELIEAYGDEFEKLYLQAEEKIGIRKRKMKARDLLYHIAKVRLETGNLYIFFDDNANAQTPFEEYINSSNLCCEVFLPSRGPDDFKTEIYQKWDSNNPIIKEEHTGLISLCNLSSIVIPKWMESDEETKQEIAYILLRAHDNEIETAFYPIKEGEIGNKLYRPIGIGIHGLAYWFAKNNIKFSDSKSDEEMFKIMEDITYHILKASVELAKERGPFPKFRESKWAQGWLPIDNFKVEFDKFATDIQKERWEELREEIKKYGVRFITHFAIAPTATSSIITSEDPEKYSTGAGSTEGIEPVKEVLATKVGTYTAKQFVPGLREFGMNYEIAWDISNKRLIDLAAIRQIFLDQGQSVNLYYKNPESAFEVVKILFMLIKKD